MQRIDILPQSIAKFKCTSEITSSILELLSNEQWFFYSDRQRNSRTINVQLNKDIRYNILFDWIYDCLQELKDTLGFNCDELKVVQSWGNKSAIGQYHTEHSHPNSFVSGIIYLNDSESGTIFNVDNIWTNASYSNIRLWHPDSDNHKIYYQQPAIAGDMVIFPSSLNHGVDINRSDDVRYTISFNAFPSGKIGIFDDLLGMELCVN